MKPPTDRSRITDRPRARSTTRLVGRMARPLAAAAGLVAVLVAMLLATAAGAAAQSGGGDPLQARLDSAAPGDTVVVRGGVHEGPLVIDRPVALVGRGRPHLRGQGSTHVVAIRAPGVTLEGFEISRSGTRLNQDHAGVMVTGARATVRDNRLRDVLHGIYVKGADRARIEGNRIRGLRGRPLPQRGNGIHLWKSSGNVIVGNRIAHARDGIYFSFANETETVRNTVHHVRYGLHYMYSDHNRFADNVFTANASGTALMYSTGLTVENNTFRDNRTKNGYGLLVQSLEQSTFTGNRLVGNMTGVYLENSSQNLLRGNVVSANHRGLRLTASSTGNRLTENVFRANLQTVALTGNSDTNAWSVDGRGNYWGPQGLLDLDGDRVSNVPRRVVDVLGGRRDDFAPVSLLASSPGIEALAYALRRSPLPSLPAIVDPNPLMQAPAAPGSGRRGALLLAGLLASLIGAVSWWHASS